ncbi:MAG: polysaccharide biosynthesis tyrosine autokinase [Planctomycetota bacterium]
MNNPIQRPNNTMPAQRPVRPPMAAPPGAGAMAMTPKDIVGILRRHLWMIIIFTIMGTFIGGVAWFLCNRFIPKYTAATGINVLPPGIKDPTKITESQPQKDIYYQHRFTMASLIKQQTMLEKLIQAPKIQETNWFKQFAQVDAGGEIIGDKNKAIRKTLKDLGKNMGASAPRDQNFIRISMTCGKPDEAQTIVNEMVELFLAEQRELARGDVTNLLAERRTQQSKLQRQLNDVQASLDNISGGTTFARLNLGETQSFRDYMDEKLSDLERTASNLETQQSGLDSNLKILERRATSDEFDQTVKEQIENDPIARQMRSNIAAMEPVLSRQLNHFGDEHRIIKQTRASLDQMQADLISRQNEIANIIRQSDHQQVQDQMTNLAQQLETNQRLLEKARAEYKDVDQIRNEYTRYNRQKEEKEALLKDMNKHIQDLEAVYNDPDLSTLKFMGLAPKPRNKSFPNIKLFLPGGFMLGLMAGLGLAFALEMLSDLLKSPSDVMRHIKAPLVGSICHTDDDDDISGIDLYHVVRQAPYSVMSECYRQLRTNLKLAGPGGVAHKTLLVTSGQAGEGKTTVAVNMASTLLAEDKPVLLIDANFRRPSTTRLFPHSQENGAPAEFSDYGLSNYLMGQCTDINQIVRPSGIDNLYIMDSGPLPANPTELFTTERMKNLLETCKTQFEYVVIDGPATLVSDAKALASQVDGTIVVLNAQTTHRGAGIRILRELRETHANILGTVLMGVKTRKGGYFREYYRSYQEYQRVHVEQPV